MGSPQSGATRTPPAKQDNMAEDQLARGFSLEVASKLEIKMNKTNWVESAQLVVIVGSSFKTQPLSSSSDFLSPHIGKNR